jgi:phosphatidate cytidylyltransferase
VIVSIVLLPVFFAVLFVFPPFILTLVVSVICAIAAYEMTHATGGAHNKGIMVYTIMTAVSVPIAVFLSSIPNMMADDSPSNVSAVPNQVTTQASLLMTIFFILVCLLLIESALSYRSRKRVAFRQIGIALVAGMVIPYMLSSLIGLRTLREGHLFVLLPIVAAFLTDSGAYFTGVAIGKRKAFPNISPNKTIEGYVGGLIAGTTGILIYGIILANATMHTILFPALFVYGIFGAIATELGDLVFSYVKRKCGIKDYGKLIPGHGGVLDRFDSMTFTAPIMYMLVLSLPAIILN